MLSRISLKNISSEQVRQAINAGNKLYDYNPPEIKKAPEQIARLSGYRNFYEMQNRFNRIKALGDGIWQLKEHACFLLTNPDNYEFSSVAIFRPIDITIRIVFGDRKDILGAQLGSNYGPYLFFLQRVREIQGIVGIDIDPIAISYANELGIKVLQHDAKQLPFEDSSLDLIFTNHFLDFMYCSIIDSANGLNPRLGCPIFLKSVFKEVYRVLKPGGIHIMQNEFPTHYPEQARYLHPFLSAEFYPKERLFAESMLDYIAILQKES
ncbi:hypothetical protein A2526_05340 [candidate division WOR-1 bacterium RIFOXYD2_FULL_36_8]|uniref:Methyltransferase type 11 domain-containing protein n=1 Tax=candidate division WOR-1 bacterium RIFOXYB2_FULL_36_35 TaxID=1802578 RepID=A0A1F4RZS7_UNCSA|nr:MAG: hypothetical protein A2230_03305 [candidate division WOR-1 bacterium RIFOXYA2_FULL_36_21]OGC12973.1 MAG: hypothetical protein A2290_04905 [candidate division WOR-1 bacterium RIFOXYB2_FULL_36_35]OGC19979.1 MAG: hypothetical protein A2282_08315 [candidate division WOR-1 bacterium RIFOXYA12_FULL_36_13]OGC41237.1 MAG: hypothetical protein A2526_05340 [candidate division WOR-1 bacterium RIFOXYD2_FULL_36_8]